ncbi:MAG: DNA-protecting protein DprA [Candidatus Obscuribacterales bacterium]|nr:DNA-protecting protein DprA [Candidatus Obscuribacterales bacterium]
MEWIEAINFAVIGAILGYAKRSMSSKKEEIDDLVYSGVKLSEIAKQASVVLGCSITAVEEKFRETEAAFLRLKDELGDELRILSVRCADYPHSLSVLSEAPRFLFAQGHLDFLQSKCISVVGTRNPTLEGIKRAQKIGVLLSKAGYTVVSGLAKGIDTAAHTATIKAGGRTIGVIGTPLGQYYPRENRKLQDKIGIDQLLISQFPPSQPVSKFNFPVRNLTMGGLCIGTVIVEAGETSGALYQARYCIQSGRRLFLMKSLLENKNLEWPRKFVEKGAIVISDIDDLLNEVKDFEISNTGKSSSADKQLKLFG